MNCNELLKFDGDELLEKAGVPYKQIDEDDGEFFGWLMRSKPMMLIQRLNDGEWLNDDPEVVEICLKVLNALSKHMEQSKLYGWKCPKEGEFYGYKAVRLYEDTIRSKFGFGVAKLRIPKEAKRVSPFLGCKKCRCDLAFVEEIRRVEVVWNKPIEMTGMYTIKYKTSEDGTVLKADRGLSIFSKTFEYVTGEFVRPYLPFNDNPWMECSSGIHFFVDEQDALRYGEEYLVL